MDKINRLIEILLIVISVITGVTLYSMHQKNLDLQRKLQEIQERVDTIRTSDTLEVTKYLTSTDIKYKTKYITKTDTLVRHEKDTVLIKTVAKEFSDSIEDDMAKVTVNGLFRGVETDEQPMRIDYMNIGLRYKQVNTNTQVTQTVTDNKRKLVSLGPSITAGYDPFNKQPSINVGLGMTFNLW